MQTCYNCGKEVSDETLICPDCGALVKRYSAPPQREPFANGNEEQESRQPENPYTYMPQRRAPRDMAFVDPTGRTRFRGMLIFWLIAGALLSGYMALTYVSLLFLYHNQEFYTSVIASMPQFTELVPYVEEIVRLVSEYYTAYVVLLVLSLLNIGANLFLLIGKRRLALYAFLGLGCVYSIMLFLFSSSGYGIFCAVGCGVTTLVLRGGRLLTKL